MTADIKVWATQPSTQSSHTDTYVVGDCVAQFPKHGCFRSFQTAYLRYPQEPMTALRRLALVE